MPKILVLGDLIIDHYIWASVDRISPEAPVPVALQKSETKKLGGAGNVVSNLLSLGAGVGIISVLGDDLIGDETLELLEKRGVKIEFIPRLKGRISSKKSRIMVSNQQVLRLDNESTEEITCAKEILEVLEKILPEYDLVLLSDYGKGIFYPKFTQDLIKFIRAKNKMVLIDPKGSNYEKYEGATLLTPNKKEASEALKMEISDEFSVQFALKKMKENFKLDFGLITLSEAGIGLFDKDISIFPALAKEVFDVTGAGDSVLATLGYCLADGMNIKDSIKIANLAAAVVVGKVGSADATWSEIEELKSTNFGLKNKVVTADEFLKFQLKNKKIIFTNGCFDILHVGHISYLQKARNLGDLLVVGLNSDRSVRALKGESRPINSQKDRALMLAALEFVDFVIIFDEDTPLNLIKTLRPDILVKGADYEGKEVVGSNFVKEVKLIDFIDGKSTTNIINRIKK